MLDQLPELEKTPASQRLRSRLLDMEDHLDQYTPALVKSTDGRVYICAASMPEGRIDTETYPRLNPLLKLPALGEDSGLMDFNNAAAIKRLEARFDEYGLQTIEDLDGQNVLLRANPAGFSKLYDFQVVWLGSGRKWLMLEGLVWSCRSNPLDRAVIKAFKRQEFAGSQGWLVLHVAVKHTQSVNDTPNFPVITTEFSVGEIAMVDAPVQQPPQVTLTKFNPPYPFGGEGRETLHAQISTGSYQIPIARVTPPGNGRKTPLIEPMGGWLTLFNSDLVYFDPRIPYNSTSIFLKPPSFHPFCGSWFIGDAII